MLGKGHPAPPTARPEAPEPPAIRPVPTRSTTRPNRWSHSANQSPPLGSGPAALLIQGAPRTTRGQPCVWWARNLYHLDQEMLVTEVLRLSAARASKAGHFAVKGGGAMTNANPLGGVKNPFFMYPLCVRDNNLVANDLRSRSSPPPRPKTHQMCSTSDHLCIWCLQTTASHGVMRCTGARTVPDSEGFETNTSIIAAAIFRGARTVPDSEGFETGAKVNVQLTTGTVRAPSPTPRGLKPVVPLVRYKVPPWCAHRPRLRGV